MTTARSIRVRGVVQGVGFRPFVYRLARANSLAGWVLNEPEGVDIHLEGTEPALDEFLQGLESLAPTAARITEVDVHPAEHTGLEEFTIRESSSNGHPSVRVSPDLPVCGDCLRELFDPGDPRYRYPYINCTNCGPRYSVIERLPYDRPFTTMSRWRMDTLCEREYRDPNNRRFHAQPIACPECGPQYRLEPAGEENDSIHAAVPLLKNGRIVAIKGIGGYHLACDANNARAVQSLRERKYRKEKPFAVMVRSLECARRIIELSPDAEALLTSPARPIVLAPARGREIASIARAFHRAIAKGIVSAVKQLSEEHNSATVVLSGGVFQNDLLLAEIKSLLDPEPIHVWVNSAVPPNDGGISLGQAALAAFAEESAWHA